MRYSNVYLASVGYELPSKVVTSEDIEDRLTPLYDRLGLPKGRLELMTGIKERRFWENGARPSKVASIAAKRAIESFIPAPIRLPKAELGRVPVIRRLEEAAEIAQAGFDALIIQIDAQAGLVWHGHVAIFEQRIG